MFSEVGDGYGPGWTGRLMALGKGSYIPKQACSEYSIKVARSIYKLQPTPVPERNPGSMLSEREVPQRLRMSTHCSKEHC